MVKIRAETASRGPKNLESIYYSDTELLSRAAQLSRQTEPRELTEPSRRTRQAESRGQNWSRDVGPNVHAARVLASDVG